MPVHGLPTQRRVDNGVLEFTVRETLIFHLYQGIPLRLLLIRGRLFLGELQFQCFVSFLLLLPFITTRWSQSLNWVAPDGRGSRDNFC
mmetsp:Transcript_7675/g.7071  ORF Transcript_7675/g.7071 Transcript_7675/m.7071 type:complete len:88 (-) Transcript_7675:121-384(-)